MGIKFGQITHQMPSRNGKGEFPPKSHCDRCGGAFQSNFEWAWGDGGTVVHADMGVCLDNAQTQHEEEME